MSVTDQLFSLGNQRRVRDQRRIYKPRWRRRCCQASRSSNSAAKKTVELFPEFAEYLQSEDTAPPHHGKKRKRCWEDSVAPVETLVELTLDEEEALIQEAWADLEDARLLWESEHEERQHFLTRILGGAWTKKHKRVSCDAIAGFAKGAVPKAWAKQYGLDRMNSFAFIRYSKEAASSLALEWCSRMQYFFGIWQAQENPDYSYTQADVEGYEESLEWIDFMLGIPDDWVHTLERARKLRQMQPLLIE